MKKFVALILSGVMMASISLTACSKGNKEKETEEKKSQALDSVDDDVEESDTKEDEDPDAESHFLTVWRDYSIRLKELTVGDTTILSAKDAAEDAMYQTVCRTERISASENADIIDDSDVHIPVEVLDETERGEGGYGHTGVK